LRVIDDHRPEVLGGRIFRNVQLVGLAAIQIVAILVGRIEGILRTYTDHLLRHRWRIHRGRIEEQGPCIQIAATLAIIDQPPVIATDEAGIPTAVFIEVGTLVTWPQPDCAGSRVTNRNRLGQDLLHPRIGFELLALLDANRGRQSAQFRFEQPDRLLVEDMSQLFIKCEGIRMDRVEGLVGTADEFHLWRVFRLGQRIDLQAALEGVDRHIGLSIDHEAAQDQPVRVAGRLGDEDLLLLAGDLHLGLHSTFRWVQLAIVIRR